MGLLDFNKRFTLEYNTDGMYIAMQREIDAAMQIHVP